MPPTPEPTPASRSYRGESQEQRAQKRRDQFIAAGKRLFGTIGYRRTTVRALCKEAGLTDRYFYESFNSTEDLLVAVYQQLILNMELSVLSALQIDPPPKDKEEWIASGLDAFFAAVEDHEAARIVWLEVLGVSPVVDAIYTRTLRQFAEMLLTLVRSAVPNWPVDTDAGPVVAMGAIGAASEAAKGWMMSGYQAPRSTMVRGIGVIFRGAALMNLPRD